MPNVIQRVGVQVDPGVAVNVTRRKGDTSKQILLTVNKDTVVDVSTAPVVAPQPEPVTMAATLRPQPDTCAITGTAGVGDGNWAAMSAGKMFARELADAGPADANLDGRHASMVGAALAADVGLWYGAGANTLPVIDALGLRFDIETGSAQPDWYFKLPQSFGANSYFALQWDWRCNQIFRDTAFLTASGGYPGIKLAIVNLIESSSTWPKLVVSTVDQHKFPYLYQYDQNGNTRNLQVGINNGADFDWEPKEGVTPTCLYTVNNATPTPNPTPGCENLPADKWVTFNLEVQTDGLITGTNTWHARRKLWVTIDGARRLVVDYSSYMTNRVGRNAQAWTGVWLNPYMTDRSGTQTFPSGTPSVWYRRVIAHYASLVGEVFVPGQTIDSFTSDVPSIVTGQSATLSWQTTNATAVRLDGVAKAVDGSQLVSPTSTTIYTLQADGSVPTIQQQLSLIVTSAPDPTLPSWVPPTGTFAEFTLNTPADVGMNAGVLGDWCGGAWIPIYGTRGAVAYHGGREHVSVVTNPQQAVYLLNLETRSYERKCYPTQTNTQSLLANNPSPPPASTYSGTPNDDWGAYTDGSPGAMHTYAGLCEMPPNWNGGVPAMVRVGQSAGASMTLLGESYAATWKANLSKASHTLADPGWTRITGNINYHFDSDLSINSVVSDAPTACIDRNREGWWSFSRTASGSNRPRIAFTHRTGVITTSAAPNLVLSRWSKLFHFTADDVLCVMCDEPTFGTQRFGTVKLLAMNSANVPISGTWVTIQPTLPASPAPTNECGYIGPQWSTLLNAFVGLDTNFTGTTVCRVWKLTPPPTGQLFTGTWAWTYEDVASFDGSIISKTDSGSMNGAWGRLIECPSLKSLVWTRGVGNKGQLIRLSGMT